MKSKRCASCRQFFFKRVRFLLINKNEPETTADAREHESLIQLHFDEHVLSLQLHVDEHELLLQLRVDDDVSEDDNISIVLF